MEQDNEVIGKGDILDFGARIYDSRLGKFLSIDPDSKQYPEYSNYIFVRDNPILRLDPSGKWDIEVHAFSNRGIFEYAILI